MEADDPEWRSLKTAAKRRAKRIFPSISYC